MVLNNKLNLLAPINDTGYGVVGMELLRAAFEEGFVPALFPLPNLDCVSFANKSDFDLASEALHNAVEYDSASPSIRVWHQFDLAQHVGSPRIGYTFWEVDRLKRHELHQIQQLDHIAVPTLWHASVLVNQGVRQEKIRVAKPGVNRQIFKPNYDYFGRDATTFLNVGKWELRKGQDVLIEAFRNAFTPKDNVRLILCGINPFNSDAENAAWVRRFKNHELGDKVVVLEGRLPNQEAVAALMNDVDYGVFPARAEGWGLETAEMMAIGKHVIVSDYGGHTGYCTPDNSTLIPVSGTVTANDGKFLKGDDAAYDRPAQWANLDDGFVDRLADAMKKAHRRRIDSVVYTMNHAGVHLFEMLTWGNTLRSILGEQA